MYSSFLLRNNNDTGIYFFNQDFISSAEFVSKVNKNKEVTERRKGRE